MNRSSETSITTVNPNLVDIFDEYGMSNPPEFNKLIPIINSSYSGISGEKGDIDESNYVGHVAYSSDYDAFVYQIERDKSGIIYSVPGEGIAISEHIIKSVKNDYDVEYVFCGRRESNNILVISIESFKNEWHTEGYDKQLYATLSEDVKYELRNAASDVLSEIPSMSDEAITKENAQKL